jgi:adenylosuccinate lyase
MKKPGMEYRHPLIERYASDEMVKLFSPFTKFRTWRRLWIALAEAEQELGLDISDEQLAEMRDTLEEIDLARAVEIEKETRHDVMAHIKAWGEICPKAKGIIHLGATSCFVGDNADLIVMREALELIRSGLVQLLRPLKAFCLEHAELPTLGFTHYQPAQLVTVGKRASLWLQDFVIDLQELLHVVDGLCLRGVKGTTGTQASFLKLFDGDSGKVKKLNALVTEKMDFGKAFIVTGQTYTRKIDSLILNVLSGIAQSASKMTNDIRLLSNLKEASEPFGKKQIGSSAMAYKKNPMRSERICSLARYVIVNAVNPALTASQQWLERTLDDSANRRMAIPESFLAVDAILTIAANIADGLVVHPAIIARNIAMELPFMATENILMEAVKEGGDRQELHERIRELSVQAAGHIREGGDNTLLEDLKQDALFAAVADRIDAIVDPVKFTGRAAEQVQEFIQSEVDPLLERFKDIGNRDTELKV